MFLINAEWRAGELMSIFCLWPPMAYAMMGPQIMSDVKIHLDHVEAHVNKVLGWVDSLPPPPLRRSTPNLVGNTLKNIATQLARCALSGSPPPRSEPMQ
ncbi:hypothetical protein DUNSADRAFT_12834 [Dunaliella salina]|uniref:Encoded protein n=1 Tax=Dunaliella salina TaxID=3046 RepID=A0ABQ7H9P1_DUNSA|nr:hypothetical protein DUNSADRAFT_12834 [Dunaliella salina]|eukprot:KAF5843572.1 hypothetical protein DUNSADRAFT_12834 [Dunaliella salina]